MGFIGSRTTRAQIARMLGIQSQNLPIETVYQADVVICPVYFDYVHWGVIAFDFASKILYLLDAMSQASRAWVGGWHSVHLQACRKFLEDRGENWDAWARRYKCRPPFPMQKVMQNSGVLACAYMHALCGNRRLELDPNSIKRVRWFMGHCLYLQRHSLEYIVPL